VNDGMHRAGAGATKLTMDIYDRIIQTYENERCTYDKTAVVSLHENLTGFDPCIQDSRGFCGCRKSQPEGGRYGSCRILLGRLQGWVNFRG